MLDTLSQGMPPLNRVGCFFSEFRTYAYVGAYDDGFLSKIRSA
jgi:hypothetical protein